MIPMSDGGWTIVGRNQVNEDTVTGTKYHWGAWILRLDENADTIWTHSLAVFPELNDSLGTAQYLHSVAELSSGSVVASGYYENYWPPGPSFSGILVKVDKNGCIDTLLCPSVSSTTSTINLGKKVQVYPNPTSDAFGVYFSDVQSVDIQLFSAAGQIVLNQSDLSSGEQIEVGHLPKGLYFYIAENDDGQIVDVGKIVIEN